MLHKKYVNRGFTLVELLSVIVILAIILVIAVPKIMSVITDSKKSSLETSAKMIASSAEKTKMQNTVLGKEDEEIKCEDVAKLNTSDYDLDNCTITFDTNNNASVTIKGKGKFDGLYVCGGTKTQATAQTEICTNYTPTKFFTYGLYAINSSDIILEDLDKCADYTYNSSFFNQDANCPLSTMKEKCEEKYLLEYVPINKYDDVGLKLKDNAEVGIIITNYNIEGGKEVIIPNTIDGYPVIGLQIDNTDITKLIVPDTIKEEYSSYYDTQKGEWKGEEIPPLCPPVF